MNARLSFDAELESLSASLIRMGALATDAIDKAIEALEANDGALAQSVIAGDRNIDDMERSIEHQCLTLLLRQQPVAGDLRKISTAIKMITDIERIGDAAADIAEITTHIKEHGIRHCGYGRGRAENGGRFHPVLCQGGPGSGCGRDCPGRCGGRLFQQDQKRPCRVYRRE